MSNEKELTQLINDLIDKKLKSSASYVKWSQFPGANSLTGVEKWVGLQSGINIQNDLNSLKSFFLSSVQSARFTPSIVLFNGINAASGLYGFYTGNTDRAGGIINVTMKLLVTSDNSNQPCQLTLATPIPAYFTDATQAQIVGAPQIIVSGKQNAVGNIGTGWGLDLYAYGSNGIHFNFEVFEPSTQYVIDVSYKYQIQNSSLAAKKQHEKFKKESAELLKKRTDVKAQEKLEVLKQKILKGHHHG